MESAVLSRFGIAGCWRCAMYCRPYGEGGVVFDSARLRNRRARIVADAKDNPNDSFHSRFPQGFFTQDYFLSRFYEFFDIVTQLGSCHVTYDSIRSRFYENRVNVTKISLATSVFLKRHARLPFTFL